MKNVGLILFFIFFGHSPLAEQIKAVNGKVAVDGAAVYAKPDFDSEVIDYLNQGTKVPASTKQYTGQGGMGLFHKVRTPRGKLGYLPDTDVVLPKGSHVDTPKDALPRISKKEQKERERQHSIVEKDEEIARKSVFMTRYMGGSFALVDYTEKFSGEKLHSQTPFFGFRMTGPDILFKAAPLDFNIQVSPMVPKYLGTFAHGGASGFLLMSDLNLYMPLYGTPDGLLYYTLGLMLTVSQYKVEVGDGSYDSTDLRIGVPIGVGYGYRYSNYIVRADARYYIEKTLYLGFMLTAQMEY